MHPLPRSVMMSCKSMTRRTGWSVGDAIQVAISKVQLLLLLQCEWTRPQAAENADLVSTLVDGAITVEPLERARARPRVLYVAMSSGTGLGLNP